MKLNRDIKNLDGEVISKSITFKCTNKQMVEYCKQEHNVTIDEYQSHEMLEAIGYLILRYKDEIIKDILKGA